MSDRPSGAIGNPHPRRHPGGRCGRGPVARRRFGAVEQGHRNAVHAARLVECDAMVAGQLVGQFVAGAGRGGADDRPGDAAVRALPGLAAALPRPAPADGTAGRCGAGRSSAASPTITATASGDRSAMRKKLFPGPDPVHGGIAVGEAYRVDHDQSVAGIRFDPADKSSWGMGGKAPLLIDPCTHGSGHSLDLRRPRRLQDDGRRLNRSDLDRQQRDPRSLDRARPDAGCRLAAPTQTGGPYRHSQRG